MLATGRIDMVITTIHYIYVIELKLTKNGGISAAEKQMIDHNYLEPFKADKRKVVGLAIDQKRSQKPIFKKCSNDKKVLFRQFKKY